MIDGRAAWNVVTSVNDGEAHNMGREVHLAHDLRYDRADEFMEIVLGHWDAWDDDALVVDKQTGLFAHPDKVHRLDYDGKFLQSRGPFTVPRSRARPSGGHPGRRKRPRQDLRGALGRDGVRQLPEPTEAQRRYAAFKSAGGSAGRDPDKVTVSTIAYFRWSRKPAPKPRTRWPSSTTARGDGQPSLLSEAMNFDF